MQSAALQMQVMNLNQLKIRKPPGIAAVVAKMKGGPALQGSAAQKDTAVKVLQNDHDEAAGMEVAMRLIL